MLTVVAHFCWTDYSYLVKRLEARMTGTLGEINYIADLYKKINGKIKK